MILQKSSLFPDTVPGHGLHHVQALSPHLHPPHLHPHLTGPVTRWKRTAEDVSCTGTGPEEGSLEACCSFQLCPAPEGLRAAKKQMVAPGPLCVLKVALYPSFHLRSIPLKSEREGKYQRWGRHSLKLRKIEPILLMQVLTHLWVLNWPLMKGVPVWCLDLTLGLEKKLSGTNSSPDTEGFKRTQPECSRTILRIP